MHARAPVSTGALQFFRSLRSVFPNHLLIANDFDSLPPVRHSDDAADGSLSAVGAPHVTAFDPSTGEWRQR